MKTHSKLNINSGQILNNAELITLKGGTELLSWLTCRVDGVICWSNSVDNCESTRYVCNYICGPWTEAVCVGPIQ